MESITDKLSQETLKKFLLIESQIKEALNNANDERPYSLEEYACMNHLTAKSTIPSSRILFNCFREKLQTFAKEQFLTLPRAAATLDLLEFVLSYCEQWEKAKKYLYWMTRPIISIHLTLKADLNPIKSMLHFGFQILKEECFQHFSKAVKEYTERLAQQTEINSAFDLAQISRCLDELTCGEDLSMERKNSQYFCRSNCKCPSNENEFTLSLKTLEANYSYEQTLKEFAYRPYQQ